MFVFVFVLVCAARACVRFAHHHPQPPPATISYLRASGRILDSYEGVSKLFVGAYGQDYITDWQVSTIICCVMAFGIGPLYVWYQRHHSASWQGDDRTEEIVRGVDVIAENQHVTSAQRRRRRIMSLCVFLVIIAIQTLAVLFIHLQFKDDLNEPMCVVARACWR